MAVMFIFSTFVLLVFANYKLIKTTIEDSNIHNIANITKLHQNIYFQPSFRQNSHTLSSYSSVFRTSNMSIGVNPLLSPGHSPRFNQSLAAVFHHVCHFSITFIRTDSFLHPGHPFFRPAPHLSANFSAVFRVSNAPMDFSGFESLLSFNHASPENRHFAHNFHFFHQVSASFISADICFHISPGLFSLNKWPLLILTGPPFYCSRRTRLNLSMLLLLIIGGVEVNPGLSSSPNLTFGMLNTRSVVNKAPLLHSLITDNDLSILAITETWVKSDDPPVIMNGPAPPGYRILHVHRDDSDHIRGGGLAVIHRDTINVQPRKHKINHSSFELQLVNVTLQSRDIVLADIYRPPSSSKSLFYEEFGLLLTNLGTDAVDRLIICGDFNLPDKIDNGLAELLHSTSFTQFVNSPTRHDSHHDRSSLLDLIITPSSSKLVAITSVVSSHEISDHDLTLANLNTKRYKSPQRTYHYRNIKSIDLELFEQTILSSSLFSSPDPTVDGYANQMETELTSILD